MTMHDLNPMRALRDAWSELEDAFEDVPEEHVPNEMRRARESVDAMRELKASVASVGAERRRLKSKAQ